MPRPRISRRSLLLGSAAALACGRPKATGFHGYCFVANEEGRSVAVVDLNRFRVRKQIPLDAAPASVLPHPAAPKVFVLAPQAGTVYEIDAASLSVSRRARAGNQAVGMRLSPRHDALWVLYRDPAALIELPLGSLRPARRIGLPPPGGDFDFSSENEAAIARGDGRGIVLASLARAAIERTIPSGVEASIVRFRNDGRQLIVGSRPERILTIFDVASGKTVVRLPLSLQPRHFCFTSDGGQLFITGDGLDGVVTVYPYRTEVAQTMLAGRAPGAMAVIESPPFLLVANPETNGITVLDVDSGKLVALVQVGQAPRQILITPDKQQYALVLNEKSGDLAVIRIYSLTAAASMRYWPTPLFTLIPVGEKPVSAAVLGLG